MINKVTISGTISIGNTQWLLCVKKGSNHYYKLYHPYLKGFSFAKIPHITYIALEIKFTFKRILIVQRLQLSQLNPFCNKPIQLEFLLFKYQ